MPHCSTVSRVLVWHGQSKATCSDLSSAFSLSQIQMCFSVTRLTLSHGLSVYRTAGHHLSVGDCLTDALGVCHSRLEYLVHCQGRSESAGDTSDTGWTSLSAVSIVAHTNYPN